MTQEMRNPGMSGQGFKDYRGDEQNPHDDLGAKSFDCQDYDQLEKVGRLILDGLAKVSVFTSSETLTKSFSLDDGKLVKRPGGQMTSGQVEQVTLRKPSDFAALLPTLKPNQATAYGVSEYKIARIAALAAVDRAAPGITPTIARTAQNFTWNGPGILMLDYDPPKDGTPPLTRNQFVDLVVGVCPEIVRAPMVICDSASSHIWNTETGEELIGARGLRIYIFVADADDIPRAGKVLFNKLWLAGHGRIEVSAAGTMLVRGPIDIAVHQPERLDFAAGAACEPPLEQRRPALVVRNNDAPPLDTRRALPPLTAKQEAELHRLVQAAKEKARPEAARVREQWLDNRVDDDLARNGMTRATHPREAQAKRNEFAAAAETSILHGNLNIYLRGGQVVTVDAILADPEKFDGMRCADPLEPSYGNDDRVALIILSDGPPRIYSHAHGGKVYYLGDVGPAVQVESNGPAVSKSSAVVLCAADIRPESIVWIWDGYLAAGKLHILGGAPGTGKTTLALIIAAIITRGGRYPDGSLSRMGRVLIWSGEDDPTDTIVPRLIAAGADLSRVHILSGISTGTETRPFDPATDMAELVRVVREIGDVRLIIVDPVVSAVAGDSHKNAEVRRSLQPLVTLGAETGAAILGITHFSKGSQGRDATERIVGSIAFAALARVVMVAAKRQDAEAGAGRVFARAKSNIGSDRGGYGYDLEQIELPGHPGVYASRVVWGEAIDGDARDILAQAEATDDGDDGVLSEAESFIEQMLEAGPVTAKVMQTAARDAGVTFGTLKRAKKKMGILSERVPGSATAWQWVRSSGSSGSTAPTSKNMSPLLPLRNGAGSGGDQQSKRIKGIKNLTWESDDPLAPLEGAEGIVEVEI